VYDVSSLVEACEQAGGDRHLGILQSTDALILHGNALLCSSKLFYCAVKNDYVAPPLA